jgi:hypothetical protein
LKPPRAVASEEPGRRRKINELDGIHPEASTNTGQQNPESATLGHVWKGAAAVPAASSIGRPTLLTPAVADRVIALTRLGATIDAICEHLEIHRDTLHGWRQEGRKALALAYARLEAAKRPGMNLKASPWLLLNRNAKELRRLQRLAEFSYRYSQAACEWELRALARIVTAGQKKWQANAWLLERRKPEVWGRRSQKRTAHPAGDAPTGRVIIGSPKDQKKNSPAVR